MVDRRTFFPPPAESVPWPGQFRWLGVLPSHPQPLPLESFTGYLNRLGEANHVRTRRGLAHLCFPMASPVIGAKQLDFPPPPEYILSCAQVAACPPQRLMATTLFGVAAMFGRAYRATSVSYFLSGMVGDSLRYCPRCLGESPVYYRLPWRFTLLEGCPVHGCRLLDRCGSCGAALPFIASPPRVGVCSACGTDLSVSLTPMMGRDDGEHARDVWDALEYALGMWSRLRSPDDENDALGSRLRYDARTIRIAISFDLLQARLMARQTREDVAEQAGLLAANIAGIETGRSAKQGVPFRAYVQYAYHMGVPLLYILDSAVDRLERGAVVKPERYRTKRDASRWISKTMALEVEEELLRKVRGAAERMQADAAIVSREMLYGVAGHTDALLQKRYPAVHTFVRTFPPERKLRSTSKRISDRRPLAVREAEWIPKVENAIVALRARHEQVTPTSISRELGVSANKFRVYPAVLSLMRASAQTYQEYETSIER